MAVAVYGIPNCDSVKKVRSALDAAGIDYVFHDYKKSGAPADLLRQWVASKGVDTVLNRKGTTWRNLDDATRASVVDAESALAVMLAHPSTIKRPIMVKGPVFFVGLAELDLALPLLRRP